MMRVAYIAIEESLTVPKVKKVTKNEAFKTEVLEAIQNRMLLDEKRAGELFSEELSELEQLKSTLYKLKNKRDEIL